MKRFMTPGGIFNATPPRIIFGQGTAALVAAEVEFLNASRALVISTPGRDQLGQTTLQRLGAKCVGFLPEAISQVPIELAQRGRKVAADLGADCLVAVGGGASIGLAKGIALELAIPIINIPTTYSGSEMTGFCGITIDGIKRMHTSLNMLAHTVIYDPELTLGLPIDVSAASAMNALAHCIDTVVVDTCSPIIAQAAYQGAQAIGQSLEGVVNNPQDMNSRTTLLYGAYLSGAALTGGFALQHGIAHVLGGSFGVSHGLSHALVLPHIAAFYARHFPEHMHPLAQALGVSCSELGSKVFDMLVTTGLPTGLSQLGFDPSALDHATQITIDTDNGKTPISLSYDTILSILKDTYHGVRPQ
jgi:alcohol dehydrogenase class IV